MAFPTIRSGTAVSTYPATLATERSTRVVRFVDDHEQRWRRAVGLIRFEVNYVDINGYDLSKVREFFRDQKGRFSSTPFSITINGNTYDNCVLEDDRLVPRETKPNLYSLTLNVRQMWP